jgi:hypothetical protein
VLKAYQSTFLVMTIVTASKQNTSNEPIINALSSEARMP